jgi:4-hydroxy-3-polyprenylbenzoate decarboxylase
VIASFDGIAQIVIYDDFVFSKGAQRLNDYLWITYTRSNPSSDVYGVNEFVENKHWGCKGPMIIDARKKPHHAPELRLDAMVEKRAEKIIG